MSPEEMAERGLSPDREWVPDAEVTCLYCQRMKNRKVCRCGNPTRPGTRTGIVRAYGMQP